VKEHVSGLLESGLKDRSKVLLVTRDASCIPWFAGRFAAAGFGARVLQPNSFYVVVFERSAAAQKDQAASNSATLLGNGSLLIGSVGQLEFQNRYDLLVEVAKVITVRPEVRFVRS
jgi:hypothetical protein